MKKYFVFSFVFFLVAVFAASAKAAVTRSYVYLNWSKFKWQGISVFSGQPAPTITWISQEESIYVENQDDSYDDSADNWSDDLVGFVSTPPSKAEAATKSNVMKSEGKVYTSGYAYSEAKRWGKFKVSGSGLIVFSVPYTIVGNIYADPMLEDAYLGSDIYLAVYCKSNSSRLSFSDVSFSKDYEDGDVGTWIDDGVSSVVLYFNDGEIGNFLASVDAYATQSVVPIPSSIIILISGIGMIFIRRSYAG